MQNKSKILISIISIVIVSSAYSQLFSALAQEKALAPVDNLYGWKYPVAKFPSTGLSSDASAYSDIRDPGGISQGLPVRLKIPAIGVDTAIEDAYITPDGRMDVPAGSINVAWFALGPHPGQVGSAVIGGHFGIDNGVPKVFFDLNKLIVGDKVYIEDDSNNTIAFIVKDIQLFDRRADSISVFTSSDGIAHLNLITCEGVWNKTNDTYPDRRVVFTDAIPSEEVITVKEPPSLVTPTVQITSPPLENIKITPTLSQNTISQNTTLITKSLYDDPIDGVISTSLLASIVLMAIKIVGK